MKRLFDLIFGIIALFFLFVPLLIIASAVLFSSRGPIIYWSDRIGINNCIFRMPKFRTMLIEAPITATHLMHNTKQWVTPTGAILRKYSLDELPQLWSIVVGDMSFVGPRPALFNQEDLIALRIEKGVHRLKPGLTGWAQVNGRDDLTIEGKVMFDAEYYQKHSFKFDILILWLTVKKVLRSDGISH